MKKILAVFIFSLFSLYSFGQADQTVADLLNGEDYLELRRVYPSLKDSLHYPMLGKLSEAYICLAFDEDPQTRVDAISELVNTYGAELGAENVAGLIGFLSLELVKLDKSDEALKILEQFISAYTDKAMLAGLKNNYNIVSGLSKIKKSEVIRNNEVSNEVHFSTELVGADKLWYVPVEVSGVMEPFIFDTGASQSFVSKDFAQRHNIKIVSDSIMMGGVGGSDYTSLGVIDTLKLGNIVYTNMPVYIGETNYPKDSVTIEAVLGVPFMKNVGAISIAPKANKIRIIGETKNNQLHSQNVSLCGNRTLMEVYCKNKRLLMFCDTGSAYGGSINANVHKESPILFDNIAQKQDSILVTGFGGSAHVKTQRIPSIDLKIGNTEKRFSEFQLVDKSICDGELGIKFFKQCEQIIIDLNHKYIYIE